MKTIDFAVAGFGHIGRRHASIIRELPYSRLVSLIDPNVDALAQEAFPDRVPHYTQLDTFLQSGIHTDVVCLCTPNGLHSPQAIAVMEAGMHVLIEKPMGLRKSECEKVIHTSLQTGCQVFVVKQNRYSPPVKWLKEIVATGQLGQILNVQINCFWNRDERYYGPTLRGETGSWKGRSDLDGGVLFTQFSHFIDIMYWIFGDINNIHSRTYNYTHANSTEFADSGMAYFEFLTGSSGSIHFSTSVWDRNLESSITVIGSRGSVKIGGQYMNAIEYCHIDQYTMPELQPTNPPNNYGQFTGSAANHHYVIENVVKTLNGQERATTNMLEGMKVVEIIERIYASAEQGQRN